MTPLPEGPFDIMIADPPWKFKTFKKEGGNRSADRHYDCMSVEDIAALPVRSIMAKNAVLLLWATSPMLPQALEVMRAWGAKYVSSMVWDKQISGTGYWTRNQHELVLIGKWGTHRAPAPPFRRPSVISDRRTKHSQKPGDLHEYADAAWPDERKVELFSRRPYPGWTVWGDDPAVAA